MKNVEKYFMSYSDGICRYKKVVQMPSDLNPANEKSVIKEHTHDHYIRLLFFHVVAPENIYIQFLNFTDRDNWITL